MGKMFFYKPVKSDMVTMITFKRLQLVKEMITQLIGYQIILFQRTLQDDTNRFKQRTSA